MPMTMPKNASHPPLRPRPLSPHLQIYRLPQGAIFSITHRLANIANFFIIFVGLWWLAALVQGQAAYADFMAVAQSIVGQVALLGWTFCFLYNMAHDVRHLFWDFGRGFELLNAARSSAAILVFSVLATVAVWLPVWFL